mmetsp:Transcript_54008/g.96721  ORF Transcript_54008/g.96721 Transcript_54008/m.96721 type:complete len:245 (+) Transcript_54008:62-796(+)|eukprot:CAMPEP_0197628838 /NCGR_PEP_ID=MMETSP1338-20131121/6966_1 /TAXON_ID=43686 ORGANISM="Pelagodinium beii, Strain RCC1491" /NCGR_SAMPLE_ID=MMETSP1338 /ASSEMBLY_ACC=CAM_ASM_000754 /LENGTH=244 /DNA_ID=CAMNT_0043199839 /DNA_START=53 /DNA_END=787 /DNA_ORIENTATION=+
MAATCEVLREVLKKPEGSLGRFSAWIDDSATCSTEDLSTTGESEPASSDEEYPNEKLDEEDVEEELSLDARLATAKRWRRFRAAPPGLAPPGLKQGPAIRTPRMLIIGASALLIAPNWLKEEIQQLSLSSLEVDAWQQLLEPDPEDPEWQLLSLVDGSGLLGFCTYAFFEEGPGQIMSVHHVVISQACRGMGWGRKLLADLLRRAEDAGAWAVKLFSRSEAVGFYEKEGFSVVGSNLLMEKRLK